MIKDGEVLSVLQDHESRITKQEEFNKNLYVEVKELKNVIDKGNRDASEKLDLINDKLLDEHLYLRRSSHDTKNTIIIKIVGSILGAGGVIYALYDIFMKGVS